MSLIMNGGYVPTLLFHERCVGHGDQELPRSSLDEMRRQFDDLEDRGFNNCCTM